MRSPHAHLRKHGKMTYVTTFTDLGLSAPLLKALDAEGYSTPTPIQAQAIPPLLQGKDLLGIAQTGTGKTAAFALPILQRLAGNPRPAPRKGCRALVLSPTRELATQIAESFRTYGRFLNLSVAVIFGGVAHRPQIQATKNGVDVLVATPGRLLDHMAERNLSIEGTEIFVLDEADQMLDLGFVKPIRRIVSALSHKRQNLFFSATMPGEIGKLAAELLHDPVKVAVAPAATTVERVSQRVIHVEASKKRALLVELFANPELSRALVFTRTKRGADRVARHLEEAGVTVAAIHGNKSQKQRENALDAFRNAHIRVLVATDIAARGIDIDQVSHVVNYELPDVPESYVHRIGRTARAGAAGSAISLVDGEERPQLRDIERLTRQSIPAEDRRHDAGLTADQPRGQAKRRAEGRDRAPKRDGGEDSPRARHGARKSDGHRHGSRRHDGPRREGWRRRDGEGHAPRTERHEPLAADASHASDGAHHASREAPRQDRPRDERRDGARPHREHRGDRPRRFDGERREGRPQREHRGGEARGEGRPNHEYRGGDGHREGRPHREHRGDRPHRPGEERREGRAHGSANGHNGAGRFNRDRSERGERPRHDRSESRPSHGERSEHAPRSADHNRGAEGQHARPHRDRQDGHRHHARSEGGPRRHDGERNRNHDGRRPEARSDRPPQREHRGNGSSEHRDHNGSGERRAQAPGSRPHRGYDDGRGGLKRKFRGNDNRQDGGKRW